MNSPDLMLAEYVAKGDVAQPAARERARMLLADAIVLSQANADVPRFSAIHEVGAGTGTHRSWATGRMLGPTDAVYANACAIHARFQDDTDMSTWSHPGSFVIPAAVAASIESGTTLGMLVDAIVVGYSATRWLGAAGAVADGLKSRGFRPSPIFAPLGAAGASARALGLNIDRTAQALGAAATIGRGTLHSVGGGGDDWRLHNAGGARDGFCLALAAQRGMRAAPDALTARNGFLRTVTGSEEVPSAWATAPDSNLVELVWHKALPVLGDNMAAALAARDIGRTCRSIEKARVTMNAKYAAFPGTQHRPPYRSATAKQASVRFVVAHLLLHGDITYRDLVAPDDPAVLILADRLEIVPDAEMAFEDAVVEANASDGVHTARASDLPRTYYWRDRAEQIERAEHILGQRGSDISRAVLDSDESTPVAAAIDNVLA